MTAINKNAPQNTITQKRKEELLRGDYPQSSIELQFKNSVQLYSSMSRLGSTKHTKALFNSYVKDWKGNKETNERIN